MMRFAAPTAFMAQKKSVVDEAYPGDIVGIPDTGNFKIGDTLTSGENLHFKGLPSFSPEMFKYIENTDPMKSKQLEKGIQQLMDEGVAQLFTNQFNTVCCMNMARNAAGSLSASTRPAGLRATTRPRLTLSRSENTSSWPSTARGAMCSSPIPTMSSRWPRPISLPYGSISPRSSEEGRWHAVFRYVSLNPPCLFGKRPPKNLGARGVLTKFVA